MQDYPSGSSQSASVGSTASNGASSLAAIEVRPTSQAETQGNGSPFECNVCKKTFTRTDHLARHYRSHTCERPFTCSTCGKSFARIDILGRHAASHNNHKTTSRRERTLRTPLYSRVAQACVACAYAKLRCEGAQPCARCTLKDVVCEYSQRREKGSKTQSHLQSDFEQIPPDGLAEDSSMNTAGYKNPRNRNTEARSPAKPLNDGVFVQTTTLVEPQHGIVTNSDFQGMPQQMQMMFGQANVPFDATAASAHRFDPDDAMLLNEYPMRENQSFSQLDDLSLADFLKDVMMTGQNGSEIRNNDVNPPQPFSYRDVLDFNVDVSFDFPDVTSQPPVTTSDQSLGMPGVRLEDEVDPICRSGYTTPVVRGGVTLGAQAFRESLWLFNPVKGDHATAEQSNLSLPNEDLMKSLGGATGPYICEQMTQANRDSVLAMILDTCDHAVVSRVVVCFPSPQLLTRLMEIFLVFHLSRVDSWIHIPTFQCNKQEPWLLAAIISSGAVLSPLPEIRKLGFAIQEALRVALPALFERDNRTVRQLRPLQAYTLQLDVGLWSGDRRKMEISESFAQPLVTMMRRAGHFHRSRLSPISPERSDDKKTLETKWHCWVEAESFKRLAYHVLFRDVQTSMSLLVPPLVSFAEMSADLPFSWDLWSAASANEWRDLYLTKAVDTSGYLPSLRGSIDQISSISRYQNILDMQFAIPIMLCGVWALIWRYREISIVTKSHTSVILNNHALTTQSLYQDIYQLLQDFKMNASDWSEGMEPSAVLLYERLLMNLHVSFDEVQLLAGKEGEEEARRVYPLLKRWAKGRGSRLAIWHAGQVLRAAKQYPQRALRNSSAVAVYHASLAFWAYSVVLKTANDQRDDTRSPTIGTETNSPNAHDLTIILDGDDGPELQRFIALGRGIPTIRKWGDADFSSDLTEVQISDTRGVMTAISDLLRKKNGRENEGCPPLVENLSKLMQSLGNAARDMWRT